MLDEHGPEACLNWVLSLELINDLFKVPWEGKHVSMFLFREDGIDSNSSVSVLDAFGLWLFVLCRNGSVREESLVLCEHSVNGGGVALHSVGEADVGLGEWEQLSGHSCSSA